MAFRIHSPVFTNGFRTPFFFIRNFIELLLTESRMGVGCFKVSGDYSLFAGFVVVAGAQPGMVALHYCLRRVLFAYAGPVLLVTTVTSGGGAGVFSSLFFCPARRCGIAL